MKKLFIILGAILAIIVVALIVLPILFKDDIQKAIDQAIAENVNADVYYDIDRFSLSLVKNFPDATVSLGDFGVVNREPFAGDTLLAVDAFNISVDLGSIIFGDQPRISGITLNEPNVHVRVLEDGRANYDIAIASAEDTTVVTDTTASEVAFSIDHWEVNNANVVYEDLTLPMVMAIRNMNHSGSGDFTLDVFDMQTNTEIDAMSVNYDGVEYLTNKHIAADAALNINLPDAKYTFLENTFRVNEFAMGLDGSVTMPDEDINMDLAFAAKDNSFKGLLSLVPGMYLEGFEDVQTEGTFDFSGFARGTYNEESMPAFQLKLLTENARFQYPDLPTPVTNIAVDLLVDNPSGVIDNTVVNVKSFHADLGNNPIDGRFLLEGLSTYKIDTEVRAKLNLADMMKLYPMDSLALKGLYTLDLVAKGVYDSATNRIPTIDMDMALKDGYVKSGDYPPLENMRFTSTVKNQSGRLAETTVRVDDFDMTLADEPFHADLVVTNLDDYTWDLAANGTLDLQKLTQIYPLEGTQLAGIIQTDIQTKGKMSDVEAERYAQLPTSGTMQVRNLNYVSEDLPQGLQISQAQAKFNPERIALENYQGTVGKSDLRLSGYLSNYLGYALADNQTLRGQLDMKSGKFDLNEWMTEDETATPVASEEDTTTLAVVEVPKNIDFTMNANIAEVLYDDMTLKNMDGQIVVRDGVVRMNDLDFASLGGQFAMNGTYDTRNLERPAFDFSLDIKNLGIRESYQTFNTVQALAPIAQNMNGDLSTRFSIAGLLQSDMSPLLNSISGKGLLDIANAAVEDSKVVGAITAVTKLSNTKTIAIKDTQLQFEIKSGRVFVQPFDVNIGNFQTVIAGSNGIDGSLDYDLKMTVPAGSVGTAVNSAIAKFTGSGGNVSSDILLNLSLGGTYDDPKVGLMGAGAGEGGVKQAAKAVVKEKVAEQKEKLRDEVNQKKAEAEAEARRRADEAKKKLQAEKEAAERKAKAEADRLKQEAEKKANEAKEDVKQEAKDKLKKLFPPRK
ncbi:MAG: AsmA-like C-terminal region-containing protein [Tunicatimonas sp.]